MTRLAKLFLYISLFISIKASAQSLYFPPLTGNSWDTISPASLNWCPQRIDSLYTFLQKNNSKGFIILKDGKIVLEKYFGSFTTDSFYYWASAGKSLTATLAGIAQEQGYFNINDSVSKYLGVGWTSCTPQQEKNIKIKHLLTMTSGLDDIPPSPCTNEDKTVGCLLYLKDAGTRWSYHTGAYRTTEDVIAAASNMTYNNFTKNNLGNKIGMGGFWFSSVYYSKLRDMARFGLLTLNKDVWANDTILHDTAYYKAMTNTSQNFNLAYGYLWWLNGKSSMMVPGLQQVFNISLIPNAPADMFCALGKNDQKIYVIPSKKMVVVRMGEAAATSQLALTAFDNELWAKINELIVLLVLIELMFHRKQL